MEKTRCFIAVPLTPEVRAAAAALQEELRASGAEVRWVAPSHFHLTLKFLGEISPPEVEVVQEICADVALRTPAFRLHLRGVGAFPNLRRLRVVWIGIAEGATELAALATDLDHRLAEWGFPPEDRPFRAHLTVGRGRSARRQADLAARVAAQADRDVGWLPVSQFVLMKSELRPDGPRYSVLGEYTLKTGK